MTAPPEAPAADNTACQVSFEVENVGKTLEHSKKRVKWVFGKGGKEYSVTLLWSKLSGKRIVSVDDKEVFSEEKKAATFFHKFETEEGMHLHVLATSATPSKKFVSPNFIKYELIIDGQRFVKLPKQDGTPAPEEEPHNGPGSIFDILFPQGYHEREKKTSASYSTKAALAREVNRRVLEQANANSQEATSN